MSTTSKMISEPRTLVRSTMKIMKGDKVISEKVTFEKPKEIIVQQAPPALKSPKSPTSPSEKRPEFLEPISPPKPTAHLKIYEEEMKQRQQDYLDWEASLPSTWIREIERLEREREKYNKKAAWSASDLATVERIDQEIKECELFLDRMYKESEEYYESE